eukprot:gene8424-9910_t
MCHLEFTTTKERALEEMEDHTDHFYFIGGVQSPKSLSIYSRITKLRKEGPEMEDPRPNHRYLDIILPNNGGEFRSIMTFNVDRLIYIIGGVFSEFGFATYHLGTGEQQHHLVKPTNHDDDVDEVLACSCFDGTDKVYMLTYSSSLYVLRLSTKIMVKVCKTSFAVGDGSSLIYIALDDDGDKIYYFGTNAHYFISTSTDSLENWTRMPYDANHSNQYEQVVHVVQSLQPPTSIPNSPQSSQQKKKKKRRSSTQ